MKRTQVYGENNVFQQIYLFELVSCFEIRNDKRHGIHCAPMTARPTRSIAE